jgi:hypothetical protein
LATETKDGIVFGDGASIWHEHRPATLAGKVLAVEPCLEHPATIGVVIMLIDDHHEKLVETLAVRRHAAARCHRHLYKKVLRRSAGMAECGEPALAAGPSVHGRERLKLMLLIRTSAPIPI